VKTPLWTPSADRVAAANLTRFMATLRAGGQADVWTFPALYRWSLDHPQAFWAALWAFCTVRASRPWDRVLTHPEAMPGARWFEGARLNFAENLLRRRDAGTAVAYRGEDGSEAHLTHAELHHEVTRAAAALRAAGVGVGDRVAAYLPNRPETLIAMLATASLGAVWSSCSPDFGVQGVRDRFGQIDPKVLLASDGYRYAGKPIDRRAVVAEVAAGLPGLARLVVVPHLNPRPDLGGLPQAVVWDAFLDAGAGEPLTFEQLPFDHPLYILFSSGTTGRPKCIVHGAGGTLLQHLKELVLHTDLGPDDRLFYYTTCSWMMWNWLVSGLAAGAALVLYDGSPFHPGPEALFDLAESAGVTVFGTSARFLAAVEKAGVRPAQSHDLSRVRTMLSTGSPLLPGSFDYVYRDVKADVQLSSISGGTDIVSCFALGCPLLPVYRGELQCRGLGMAVEVYDARGRSLVGEPGELVCTAPFPSMPVGFWNDPDGSRYRAAYFERFPGVWTHGDWAELTETGGLVIQGRSDAVLNPGGVRIGTAEIYRQVERLPEVLESIAVGQDWRGDQRVVLFVVLREGITLDEPLVQRIRRTIREGATPRHVPAKVLQVPAIPRTASGKSVELAVREVLHGRPVINRAALANPEALDAFAGRPELDAD
jgi:acetoacetyl-CoA synthetase